MAVAETKPKEDPIGPLVLAYRLDRPGSRDALLAVIYREAQKIIRAIRTVAPQNVEDLISEVMLYYVRRLDVFAKRMDLRRKPIGMLRADIRFRIMEAYVRVCPAEPPQVVLIDWLKARSYNGFTPEQEAGFWDERRAYFLRTARLYERFRFPFFRPAFKKWLAKVLIEGRETPPPKRQGDRTIPLAVRDAMRYRFRSRCFPRSRRTG